MRDIMCKACDSQISKMYTEYEIRGVHSYSTSDFCCTASKQYYIPLDGWEKL